MSYTGEWHKGKKHGKVSSHFRRSIDESYGCFRVVLIMIRRDLHFTRGTGSTIISMAGVRDAILLEISTRECGSTTSGMVRELCVGWTKIKCTLDSGKMAFRYWHAITY